MSADDLRAHAERFVAAAESHKACRAGRIVDVDDSRACIELDLAVEMPLHMKPDGQSPNGVRTTETAYVVLGPRYPWSSPTFYLRDDFPRELPHLQPGPLTEPPRPCLVDGNQREYFFQFGLVESGVFHLVHQLVRWLRRAAIGALIDPEQGWEPTLRRELADLVIVNAEAFRAMVDRHGGHRVLKARYFRSGADEARLNRDAAVIIDVSEHRVPLKRDDKELFTSRRTEAGGFGNTVCCILWPDKLPSGEAFVSTDYLPETVSAVAGLLDRAGELGCGRPLRVFLDDLDRSFQGYVLQPPIPIALIFCARRPFHLIGSASDIELLPYLLDIRAASGRDSLFAAGDAEPVAPAAQLDTANPALLRNVSGAPAIGPVAMLGCGSVGSKMAVHLARSGVQFPVVSDKGVLQPHNMARHALVRSPSTGSKALELAAELGQLGQSPQVHRGDLVLELSERDIRKIVLPNQAILAVNTTASLGVREALSALPAKEVKPRLAEAALFGRGHGGFLLVDGADHNPTLYDLMAELYATVPSDRLRTLMFDRAYGLAEIQIGQGCGSLTMPMTDMRLSAMTAALTEQLVEVIREPPRGGQIIVGTTAENALDTNWTRQSVAPFEAVEIEQSDGWALRISQRVLQQIYEEIGRFPHDETGGVMIGLCSARLKAVTVVDLLPAPPDSVRSPARFVLGTSGLEKAISARHVASGGTLFDVGTWHSHLADQGPSPLDRKTARELAAERPAPSVLLIATPTRRYALMHDRRAP